MNWKPSPLPYDAHYETTAVLKQCARAHKALGELKGVARSIPRPEILINTLSLQEAFDSSAVEDIITTHDELFRSTLEEETRIPPATKEVKDYAVALRRGFDQVKKKGGISTNDIIAIQAELEHNKAGLRKLPGTSLKNPRTGEVVYEPPQHAQDIKALMSNLERFINDPKLLDADPLVKMAIIHLQFESIHPFYDGNGRTGRIVNILYLVLEELLDLPILYLSRYIIRNKADYYSGLQKVRETGYWEDWLLYMIRGVEETALHGIQLITAMQQTMMATKRALRTHYKFYSQDLLNHLFKHPYTKIEYLQHELGVSRVTASKYLNELSSGDHPILTKEKRGKANYYVNTALVDILLS